MYVFILRVRAADILISSADIRADSFEETIRLFTTLILNVDENRKM